MVWFSSWLFWKRDKTGRKFWRGEDRTSSSSGSLFVSFSTLHSATGGFSDDNRLGQGGFGTVYKGTLPNGKQIAVKKLSLVSRQGLKEFVNEVHLLLKVQHKNLVCLLGCCAEGDEKMLVYEFLPNRSLDCILFDKRKSFTLHWSKRFEIIVGIAKGLLYLHEESPVKIIHRDIKASNILLGTNMNPKIADFGLARLFEGDGTHVNTFRIAGTYGYMAPEYATSGYLSAKTDVFSFGILVLEIVSGRKNLDYHLNESEVDLLSYTWELYNDKNRILEVVDSSLAEWDALQAELCLRLGLSCCQQSVAARPNMTSVFVTLSSESFTMPTPGNPGTRGRTGHWTTSTDTKSGSSCSTGTRSSTTATDVTKSSGTSGANVDFSRNYISDSFTSEGR